MMLDDVKLEAIAPPSGVTVALGLILKRCNVHWCDACVGTGKTARLHLCHATLPARRARCVLEPVHSRPRSARASVTTLCGPKPPGATIWGLLSMKLGLLSAKLPNCICATPRSPRDKRASMPMVAIGVVPGMVAGVIGRASRPAP